MGTDKDESRKTTGIAGHPISKCWEKYQRSLNDPLQWDLGCLNDLIAMNTI